MLNLRQRVSFSLGERSEVPKATPVVTSATSSHGPPDLATLIAGVRGCDRAMLGRAITLVESHKPAHRMRAQELLQALLPYTGHAHRIGITGVPGVGKSTTIDQLGLNLVEAGHKVAVLAVDPTSKRTGGSILGDKTRMNRLATHVSAFIRPSPTSGTLGGVAARTRETMALVEAAGFDIVIVETVGVGQSETTVAEMVDFFLVLLLAGAGDDLQGIKKGVIEIADMIAINKADGDNTARASRAAADYAHALHILTPASPNWQPPVLTVSGLSNTGLDDLWARITLHRERLTASGEFMARRQAQAVTWMHDMLSDRLLAMLGSNPEVAAAMPRIEAEVRAGRLLPSRAVDQLLMMLGLPVPRPEA
jgi:LAO/AO transport system kinase